MKAKTALLTGLFVVVLSALGSAQTAGRDSSCTPEFTATGDWLGADVGASVPLPDGRSFWIFGDTLYGEKRVVQGDDPRMVRNTVGISTCKNGKWDMKYVIRHDAAGKPVDFFTAQHPKTWYWALDGVQYKNEIWVTLLCVRTAAGENAAMGFEGCGADLAHITGIDAADPSKWKIDYLPYVPDGAKSYPTATILVDNDNLYVFSVNDFGDHRLIATRVPVSGLGDVRKNQQYLSSDGKWKRGFDPKDAKAVMAEGSSELSIRYHKDLKKWIAIMPKWLSGSVWFKSADELTGPWTSGKEIYSYPEMQKDNKGFDPDTFCYAAREHPELEKPGELVFSYACNTGKPAKLVQLQHIYFPQVVRMPMPETK